MTLNWEAIGAIGTCLGAFATFCAVIVALWQTSLARKKSLKLSLHSNFIMPGDGSIIDGVSLSIKNTGNRNITIEEWGFVLRNNTCLTIIDDGININNAKLPITLEPDSAIDLIVLLERLSNSFKKAINENKIKSKDKLKVFVRDNFSKRYYYNARIKIENILK